MRIMNTLNNRSGLAVGYFVQPRIDFTDTRRVECIGMQV